ncbi:hypothetical protein [Bacillus sp. REN16]|uniref:hypothetical protein n=1 Tax=Bacillus sp. REN16 TaxID=2887296 RepID=UPI001E627E19|nr:hypothetical protein [Bacillus sp. REN16]MCC3355598.1 hypothetical protein [Bacillus sp. REN16]
MSKVQENNDGKPEEEVEAPKLNRFDRLMFGQRDRSAGNKEQEIKKEDAVDFNKLMGQIDEIMTSIDKIKPALKDLSPLLDYFRKK